jgi:hypothetical protein
MDFHTKLIEPYEVKPLPVTRVTLTRQRTCRGHQMPMVRSSFEITARSRRSHFMAGSARLRIGRTHLLRGWEMAELLDDRDEVILVLPLSDARRAVRHATGRI